MPGSRRLFTHWLSCMPPLLPPPKIPSPPNSWEDPVMKSWSSCTISIRYQMLSFDKCWASTNAARPIQEAHQSPNQEEYPFLDSGMGADDERNSRCGFADDEWWRCVSRFLERWVQMGTRFLQNMACSDPKYWRPVPHSYCDQRISPCSEPSHYHRSQFQCPRDRLCSESPRLQSESKQSQTKPTCSRSAFMRLWRDSWIQGVWLPEKRGPHANMDWEQVQKETKFVKRLKRGRVVSDARAKTAPTWKPRDMPEIAIRANGCIR